MSERSTLSSVISNRGFLNLWINQILVQLSYNALNFALIVWVFRLTDSNLAVSALMFAVYLPAVIFGLFFGVIVDITDRKKIIMAIDLLLSFCFFALIFLKFYFPAVLVITFLVNTLGLLYAPAEASAIPMVVKKNQLIIANTLFSITLYSCFLLGFGFSGPLIGHLGINLVFIFGGLLLFTAFLLSFTFPSIKPVFDKEAKKLLIAIKKNDLKTVQSIGFSEVSQTINLIKGKLPVLSSIMILAGIQAVIGTLAVLIPGFMEKVSKIKATDASYVLIIPLGLGIISGGFILSRMKKMVRRRVVGKGILFSGILFFLVGIAPVFSPAIRYFNNHARPLSFVTQPSLASILAIGSFLLGLAMVSVFVPSQTVLQENTPERDRGKVFSVLGVVMSALSLVPILLTGILSDIFGVNPIFIGLGVIIMLIGIFALKPSIFFPENALPFHVKQFLGLGHWKKSD